MALRKMKTTTTRKMRVMKTKETIICKVIKAELDEIKEGEIIAYQDKKLSKE
jgi:hypothetical protein